MGNVAGESGLWSRLRSWRPGQALTPPTDADSVDEIIADLQQGTSSLSGSAETDRD